MSDNNHAGITVVIPTYNRAEQIVRALNSVKNQTYRPIEVVVVDDGSTDKTKDIVLAWKEKNASANLSLQYSSKKNAGAPAARNDGISMAKGAFVHFLDSDDVLLENCLTLKHTEIVKSGAAFVYGFSLICDSSGQQIGVHGRDVTKNPNSAFLIPYIFNTSGPLIRNNVLREIGGWDESLSGCQEIEFFYRLKLRFGRGRCVPQALHQVNLHEGDSISQKPSSEHSKSAFRVLQVLSTSLFDSGVGLGRDHFRNEMEALSNFATDVCLKNASTGNIGNSVVALKLAAGCSPKYFKSLVFWCFVRLAELRPELGIYLFCCARSLVGTPGIFRKKWLK